MFKKYNILYAGVTLLLVLLFSGCAVKVDLKDYKFPSNSKILDIPSPKKIVISYENITSNDSLVEKVFRTKLQYSNYMDIVNKNFNDNSIFISIVKDNDISYKYIPQKWVKDEYLTKKANNECKILETKKCNYQCSFFSTKMQREACLSYCMTKIKYGSICKQQKGHIQQAYYKYNANLHTISTIKFNGKVINFENRISTTWKSNNKIYSIPQSEKSNLVNNISNAILNKIKAIVTPNATITQIKVAKDDYGDKIFKINMGSAYGLYSQQPCHIYNPFKNYNIGSCTISNQIYPKEAWVKLDNEDENSKVKVEYEVYFYK